MSVMSNERSTATAETRLQLPGIGYALREQNRPILDDPAINAVEITFERADDPLRIERYIGDHEFEKVSVHALKMSVASPDAPSREYLDAIRSVADENGADSISDHLGFTRDGEFGIEIGHFVPPPFTEAALTATCRNVDFVQAYCDRYGLKFYLENVASLFRLDGTMDEATFLRSVLQQTGCGWLLDVTNVYANAVNFGFDPREFISQVMPAAERVQIHLAGGFFDDSIGLYVDSHSEPIVPAVWSLYEQALRDGAGKVDAVFLERDQNFPDERGWRSEIRQVRAIAEEVLR